MRFHALADSDWRPPSPEERTAGWRWRHRIDVSFAGPASRIAVSETAPKENHAAVLSLRDALAPAWDRHRQQADGAWLVPWLERLRDSSSADQEEIGHALLVAFAQRHGRPPATYEWDVP